jgi:ubiquinone biosynthesis protein
VTITCLAEIVKVFAEEGLGSLTGRRVDLKLAAGTELSSTSAEAWSDRETATRLRRALERLGPTFVKFGQILGTPVDLFSDDFIAELGQFKAQRDTPSRRYIA